MKADLTDTTVVGNYRSEVCTAGEIMSQAGYDTAYANLSTGPSGVAPVIAPVLPIEPPPPSTPGSKP